VGGARASPARGALRDADRGPDRRDRPGARRREALPARGATARETESCIPIPPCRHADGRPCTFYHADSFRSAVRHEDVPPFTDHELALLDSYEVVGNEPGSDFDMDLEPGDVQLLSNHTNVHARTRYEDHPESAERRHLLRLWLSL